MTPEIIAPETEQFQCRHIFTDGRRCGSPAIRGPEGADSFCYYHHNSRRPIQDAPTRKRRQSRFTLPNPADLSDRSGIQLAIGEVLRRIASNEIDPRRAGLLLYGLQIASLNLPKSNPREEPAEIVSEVTHDPEHGLIAPPAELGANKPKSTLGLLLDCMDAEEPKQETSQQPVAATINLEACAVTEVYVESTTSAQTAQLTQPSKPHRPRTSNSSDHKERSHELRNNRHCNSAPPRCARAIWPAPRQQDSAPTPDLRRSRSGCS